MAGESDCISRITLEGDWSMCGITHQFQALMNWISQLSQPIEGISSPELDLAGVTELDACGCQLLSVFVQYLREQGVTPLCHEMTVDVSSKIRALGFEQTLSFCSDFNRGCS